MMAETNREKKGEIMTRKNFEEISANLAVFRLASRELDRVSASCEMFFSHAIDSQTGLYRGKKMERLWNQMAAIQDKADKMREKLDAELEAFSEIEIREIE
jgi:hypothetical protein